MLFFSAELSAAAATTLEKELESIKELHSVEPENKCRYLTIRFLVLPRRISGAVKRVFATVK